MAFSLGSLYVELKANTAEFVAGLSKAGAQAKATGRGIEGAFGKIADILAPLGGMGAKLAGVFETAGVGARNLGTTLGKTRGQILGVLSIGAAGAAGLAGGLLAVAMRAAEMGSKIYEASEKTGIGADKLSGLNAMCKETGGDFEGLSAALGKAGVNIEKGILEPGGKAGKVLAQIMGGSKNLTELGLKPMADRVQVVLSRIFAMNDVGQRNVALSALLGKGWQENVSQLRLLADQGYAPAMAQARKFGIFFDENAARQAKQFQVAVAGMSSEFEGLGLSIGQRALPKIKELMLGLPGFTKNLQAFGERYLAINLAMTGVGLPAAIKLWKDADANIKAADQAVTDFSVHSENMAEGQKHAAEETGKLTGAVKAHHNALADIIQREHDQLVALDSTSKPVRALVLEYRHTVDEIEKAVKAGGSYADSLKAQALAADIFKRKLMEIPAIIPHLPEELKTGVRHGNRVFEENLTAPELSLPGEDDRMADLSQRAGGLNGFKFDPLTMAQIAELPGHLDSSRFAQKALREETELSQASFKKLAAVFPNMTEAEVAATVAGRRMIDQLTHLDQFGTVAEQFATLKNKLITDGEDLGGKLVQILGGSVERLEDSFVRLAVTGKGSFKQMGQEIEGSLLKAGLQKGVSSVLGHFGISGGGGKPDGTASNPLHVTFGVGKDGLAGVGSVFPGAGNQDSSLPGGSWISGLLGKLKSGHGGFGSILSGIFGGFLADGGDVTPGHEYIVGERGPERFRPRVSGSIIPAMDGKNLRPLVYSPVYQISTPNVDSFRRSHSQLVTEGYRAAAAAHARNS